MTTPFDDQLLFIFDRMGYHPTCRAMKNNYGKHLGRSKKEMIEKIVQITASDAAHQQFLLDCGTNCTHLGTRQLELFTLKDQIRKRTLNTFFNSLTLSSNQTLKDSYPFPITDQSLLSKLPKNNVEIMEKSSVVFGNKTYQFAVFSTVVEHEVQIDGSRFLNQDGVALVTQQDAKFFYVTSEYRQLFHILYWCESDESAILSIDRNGISVHQSRDQLYLVRNYIDQRAIGALGKPLNVFDAIEPLYNDVDGRITKLGHVTSDGNPVRLNLSRGQTCLKQDKYHEAGEDSGYVHAKFAVGKRWSLGNVDEHSTIEVDLAGKAAMLDNAQPLSDFEVAKCSKLSDLNFAIQNVLPHAC